MRIALCYSGRPRDYRQCLENHQKTFGLQEKTPQHHLSEDQKIMEQIFNLVALPETFLIISLNLKERKEVNGGQLQALLLHMQQN